MQYRVESRGIKIYVLQSSFELFITTTRTERAAKRMLFGPPSGGVAHAGSVQCDTLHTWMQRGHVSPVSRYAANFHGETSKSIHRVHRGARSRQDLRENRRLRRFLRRLSCHSATFTFTFTSPLLFTLRSHS